MIDGFITSIVNAFILQGGGWLAACLLGIVIYIMDKRAMETRDKYEAAIQDQYNKRLDEFKELLDVVGTSTQSINNMQRSVTTSGESMNQLTQAFAQLLREQDGRQSRWADKVDAVTKQLDDVQRRVESLQKGRVA